MARRPSLPTRRQVNNETGVDSSNLRKKPKRRYKKGTRALLDIRKYQKTTGFLLKKLPFQRVVREISQDFRQNIRFKKFALEALQCSAEDYMVNLFKDTQYAAIHARRMTITPKDIAFTRLLRGERY